MEIQLTRIRNVEQLCFHFFFRKEGNCPSEILRYKEHWIIIK